MTDPTSTQPFLRQLLTGLGVAVGLSGCCLEETNTICIEADTAEACPDPEQVRDDEGAESAEAAVFFPERRYVFDGEEHVEPSTCCYDVSFGVQCEAPIAVARPGRAPRWVIGTGGPPVRIAVAEVFARERTAVVKTPEWERAWRGGVDPCIAGC